MKTFFRLLVAGLFAKAIHPIKHSLRCFASGFVIFGLGGFVAASVLAQGPTGLQVGVSYYNDVSPALRDINAERIETTATATLERLALGWTLTRMQLDIHAKVPKATHQHFIDAALLAKTKCPVARLLNTTISMNARLDA